MKRFSEQLHKKSQSVKLQADEKRELRERVVSYMEYHPLPKDLKKGASIMSPFQDEVFSVVRIPFAMVAKIATTMAVLILVIIPVMAEKAVPGDGLYAVKVRFNEELRGTLALTPYEKIEWETERLNRRIAEARLLANEGRLTDEVEAEVAQAVKQHTENAQREIDALRVEDEDEATMATIALNTTLEVQSASFRDEDSDTELFGDDNHTPKLLASVIDETLSKQEANNASSTVPAYDKLMARIELNTTRAYELLVSLELDSESPQSKDVSRRLEDINRSVQEAITLREENEEDARDILVDSLQRVQRLVVYMTEIEVDQDFNVEEIVPVILTAEEKEESIKQYKQELNKQIQIIEATLMVNTDITVVEKVESNLEDLKEVEATIASTSDYQQIKSLAEDALTLAKDTMELLEETLDASKATSTPPVIEDLPSGEVVASSSDEVASSTETEIE